jgi:N utilization substance protein B
MALNRREARAAVFELLFETEFKLDEAKEAIFELSTDNREVEEDEYVRTTYFGVCEHVAELDELIGRHAHGWKTNRISKVSRSILRLATYEMLSVADVPFPVAINEAVQMAKEYDEESAPAFINGVLNAIADTKGLKAEA